MFFLKHFADKDIKKYMVEQKTSPYLVLTWVPVMLITEAELKFPFLIIKAHHFHHHGLLYLATKAPILSGFMPPTNSSWAESAEEERLWKCLPVAWPSSPKEWMNDVSPSIKKKKSRGRIILLSQCSQTPESHYDNLVLLNLHLQFHLKNPLCFLPCKVEVRTESGQGPSARKREAEKVNILPRKEARLPCWVVRKQRQQNSSSFRKTDLRDSCRSVPG